jgi:hypothetical protein
MLYPLAYAHIRPAATNISRHRRIDIGIVRRGIPSEQRHRGHDLPWLAVSTLDDFEIEPRLLDLGSRNGLPHTLDRRDGSIADRADGKLAGSDGNTVEMHCACAALCDSATELCACKAKHVPEDPKQWHVRGDVYIAPLGID